MSFDLNGDLFASLGGQWYSISTVDGSATFLGNLKGVGDIDGLTVTPVAQNVAGLGMVPAGTFFAVDTGSLYTIDPNTLVATFIGSGEASETVQVTLSNPTPPWVLRQSIPILSTIMNRFAPSLTWETG